MQAYELIKFLSNTTSQFIDSLNGTSLTLTVYSNRNTYNLANKDDLRHLIYTLTTNHTLFNMLNDRDKVNEIETILKCLNEIKNTDTLALVNADRVNKVDINEVWTTETLSLNNYPNEYSVLNPNIHEILLELQKLTSKSTGFDYQYRVKSNPIKGTFTVRIFNNSYTSFHILDISTTNDESKFKISQDDKSVTLKHPKQYHSFKTISHEMQKLGRNYLLDIIRFALFKMRKNVEKSAST